MTSRLRFSLRLGLILLLVAGSSAPGIASANLTLESRQNTTSAAGQDAGLSFGSSRVGINGGNRNQRRRWTDDPTTLIGTESVKVNVNSDTQLTGALLAQINEDGTDGGNLALNTRNLTFKDLVDTDNSSNWSAGFSTGMRWSTPPKQKKGSAKTKQNESDTKPKKDKDFPNSSTTSIQASLNGYVRGQLTRATLGQGNLSVQGDGDLTGLNRDIDTFQTVTANRNTGGLNVDVTVDHRMFSKKGRDLIKNDFVVTALHGREMAQSVKDVVSQKQLGALDYFRQVKDYATEREALALLSKDEELHKKLTGEQKASGNQEGLQQTSDALSKAHGLDETAIVSLYDGAQTPDDTPVTGPNDFNKETANAGYYENNRDLFINVNGQEIDMTDSTSQIGAVVHENARHQYAQEGRGYDGDTETYLASQRRKLATSVWAYNTDLNGYSTTSSSLDRQGWLNTNRNSTTVIAGNNKIGPLDSRDIKPFCGPSAQCYGGNFAQRFRNTYQENLGSTGAYQVTVNRDPTTGEKVGYTAHNTQTGEIITMKPQEAGKFYALVDSGQVQWIEGKTDYAYTFDNKYNKLYEGGIPTMFLDIYGQAFSDPQFQRNMVFSVIGAGSLQFLGRSASATSGMTRSEERRVGKECRSRWSP